MNEGYKDDGPMEDECDESTVQIAVQLVTKTVMTKMMAFFEN